MVKKLPVSAGDVGSILDQEDPPKEIWQATPALLPRESHGQKKLANYSP